MRRQFLILIVGFVTIFAVLYGVSKLSSPVTYKQKEIDEGVHARPDGTLRTPQGIAQAPYGELLYVVIRDEQGQLQEVYFARSWNKLDDGTYEAIQPCVEIRQPNGQRVYIHADRGIAKVEEITGGGQNIRGGQLIGGVRIYLDRTSEGDRPTFADMTAEDNPAEVFEQLDQRREDIIRIWADELTFSMDPPEIYTPGRVTVWSAEADMVGEGLSLRWDEGPRELRSLRIERGQMIAIYSVPEDVNLLAMPGSEGAAASPAEATAAPTDETEIASATQPAAQPAELDTAPAAGGTAETTSIKNIYLAEFHDQVHVDSGGRQMRGADMLSLQFEWGREARKGLRGRTPPPTEAPPEDASQPPSGDEPPPEDAPQPPSAADPPPPEKPKAAVDPVTVTWRGPLVFRPIGYTPTPSSRKYIVKATGNKIHLVDDEAEVTCRELVFHHPQRQGELIGAPGDPTRMLLGGEQEVVCSKISFDAPAGKVLLTGPGRISQGTSLAESDGYLPDPTAEPKGDFVRCDVLKVWMDIQPDGKVIPESAVAKGHVSGRQGGSDIEAGEVTVFFDYLEKLTAEGVAEKHLRPSIVLAKQDVRIIDRRNDQTIEAVAEMLQSDLMDRTAVLYGRKKHATIHQGQNSLAGERIRLDQNRQSAVVEGPGRMRFEIESDMDGNKLAEPRPAEITWDEGMEYYGKTNAAVFTGDVRLVSLLESMDCQQMRILFEKDEPADAADQPATQPDEVAGRPDEPTTQPDAVATRPAELAPPEDDLADPMAGLDEAGSITWGGRMEANIGEYEKTDADGKTSTQQYIKDAVFFGDVILSQGSSDTGEVSAPPAGAETAGASEEDEVESGREMGLNLEHYSRRRLATITAHGDIVLRSREESDDGKLMRRLRLTGEQLFYDVRVDKLTMVRSGSMIVEDYRPPDQVAAPDSDTPTQRPASDSDAPTQRPNQTGFRWTRIMVLDQESRGVELEGEVRMVHRSGKEVLRLAGIDEPEWDRLTEGRRTLLHCQRLDAQFGPPDEDEDAGAAAAGPTDKYDVGPRLGPLEMFIATRDVNLSDRLAGGTMQVLGQRLRYNRLDGTVVVWGFMETSPIADAMLVYESQGQHSTFENPAMIFTLDGTRVKQVRLLDDVYGTGTR